MRKGFLHAVGGEQMPQWRVYADDLAQMESECGGQYEQNEGG